MSSEDDTYSSMFTALKHPIRRKILRILKQAPATYTEILNQLNIDNGLLNYHLENMRDLITKNEEDKYTLSEFGKAAVNLTEKVEEAPNIAIRPHPKLFGRRIDSKPLIALIIAILIFSNMSLAYVYQSSQNERANALNTAIIQANEINTLNERLDSQNRVIAIINSTTRSLISENNNSSFLSSSYATQIANLRIENGKLEREIADLRNLTPVLGVPTQNGTLIVRRVQFEEVNQGFSPNWVGVSPLFDNSSKDLTLSLPPNSFIVNRTWLSVDNYVDHTVGLVTWLSRGEIVSFRFNSTNGIVFNLGLWDGSTFESINGALSYEQTYRVPNAGVYVFSFAIPESLHTSKSASVSFKCYEVTTNGSDR